MLTRQNRIKNERKEVRRDPRIGQRVICRSLLPTITLLGTIQRVLHYANGVEYWHVRTDGPMTEEVPASCFIPYNGPEFRAGERVTYRVGEGGCWRAIVLHPQWTRDHLRFLIRVESCAHAAVQVRRGHTFAAHPARLSRLWQQQKQRARRQR
ncbi:MAG TPA: hypothetical protein VFB60_11065 [Ktedonobacteraceae bacterium]|nr:hypothetical protein [Ktedonobacteraceae bacterium]